jgi:hypothetical protein
VYKIASFLIIAPLLVMLLLLQLDHDYATALFIQAKQAVNRSVQAAAMQVDLESWAAGEPVLEPVQAESTFKDYLKDNLKLATGNLKNQIGEIDVTIVDRSHVFPYTFQSKWNDTIVFHSPGLFVSVKLTYPRLYKVLGPITWTIRGAEQIIPLPK